jgi:hypothetical protein
MDSATLAAQDAFAQALIQRADPRWERIFANIEVGFGEDGELQADCIALAIFPSEAGYDFDYVHLGDAALDRLRNLRDAMSKDGEEPWGATEITIDRPGAFKYAFSYEPPKRLAGKFDQGSYFRFNTYVADYAASKGSHVSAARKQ